jgi:2-dehydro-3-deoxyphosphogluconate aldolase / (4S)-4-hydroxy-2-oxoglutarate aldolase
MKPELDVFTRRRNSLDALFGACPIVPVVTIERMEKAVPLAQALVRGGLMAIEITLRTRAAFDAAKSIRDEVPQAIVGIGTVLDPDDLARATEIGAAFALSPGATPELLSTAASLDLPFVPGVQTASDIMVCVAHGFEVVKFFPAVPAGGIATLRALGGPFPNVRFCPTGGIRETDAREWLAQSNVLAIGGSWIVPAADIDAGRWDEIEARARAAAALKR